MVCKILVQFSPLFSEEEARSRVCLELRNPGWVILLLYHVHCTLLLPETSPPWKTQESST